MGLTGALSVFEAEIHHWGCLWGDLKVTHVPGGRRATAGSSLASVLL